MDNEDNLYPRSGAFLPTEPVVQVQARQTEETNVVHDYPILKGVLSRLDERITFYSSVDAYPDEVKTKPEEFMHLVAANKIICDSLRAEKTFIEGLVIAHVNK